ncbi:MAG: CU044_2847 family protein [Rhodopila sp.]
MPDKSSGGVQAAATNDEGIAGKSQKKFVDIMSNVVPISNAIFSSVTGIATKPSEVSVEIGFKITAKGSLIIASSEGEASFKAVFKWQTQKPE